MGLFSKFSKNKQEAAGQDSGYYSKADDQAVLERARSKRATSADGPAARRSRSGEDPALPEKKRARRRLVGAVALALGVAIGLPMLLDSEPKPLATDIAIQIPSKDKLAEPASGRDGQPVADAAALDKNEEIVDAPAPVNPAAAPVAATPAAAVPATIKPAGTPAPSPAATLAATPAAPAAATAATAAPAVKPVPVEPPAAPAHAPAKEAAAKAAADKLALEAKLAKEHKAQELKEARERADAKAKAEHELKLADAKAEAKAKADAEAKAAKAKQEQEQKLAKAKADAEAKARADEARHAKTDDSARAMAILEDKPSDTRYMVQVAAVASQEKVDELQNKLKEAGIKSFTQKVNTAGGGSLTRIRVGPFTSKDEAEKVRAKLNKIGLSSSLATS